MIGRWGGPGGRDGFLEYAHRFAVAATRRGTVVTGQVGELAQATVYRIGQRYMVVDASNVIRSYVHVADRSDGIVAVYLLLGGK
jgi:hypothetical protein